LASHDNDEAHGGEQQGTEDGSHNRYRHGQHTRRGQSTFIDGHGAVVTETHPHPFSRGLTRVQHPTVDVTERKINGGGGKQAGTEGVQEARAVPTVP